MIFYEQQSSHYFNMIFNLFVFYEKINLVCYVGRSLTINYKNLLKIQTNLL